MIDNWGDLIQTGGALVAIVGFVFGVPWAGYKIRSNRLRNKLKNTEWREAELQRLQRLIIADEGVPSSSWRRVEGTIHNVDEVFSRWFGPKLLSWQSFTRCFQLAYIYPILLFLMAWLFGGSGSFGPLPVMLEGEFLGRLWRFFIIVLLVVGLAAFLLFDVLHRVVAWVKTYLMALTWLPNFIATVVGAIIGAITGAVALAIAIAVAFVIVAGTFAGVFADALTGGGAFSVAFTGAVFFTVTATVVVVFSGAFSIVFAGAFAVVGYATGDPQAVNISLFFIAFYILLPLINASADWASWGMTRRLLCAFAQAGKATLNVGLIGLRFLADILFALFCLFCLALVLPFFLEGFNASLSLFTEQRIEWLPFLISAHCAPFSAGLAVTGMLFTTLIPTAIHLGHSTVSLILGSRPNHQKLIMLIEKVGAVSGDERETHFDDAVPLLQYRSFWIGSGIFITGALLAGVVYAFFSVEVFGHYLTDAALWSAGLWSFDAEAARAAFSNCP